MAGADMVTPYQKTIPTERAFIQQSKDLMNVFARAEVM